MPDNQRVAMAAFEAMNQGVATGDFTALAGYLTDDVELTFFGTTRAAGTFRGRDTVLRWFAGTHRLFPNGFQFEVRNIMSSATAVSVEWIDRAVTSSGRSYENYGVTVFELRGDAVCAYREYMDTERVKNLV